MISLIDCTLRDGGHVIKSKFGEKVIYSIVDKLVKSNVEVIELGFLKNQEYEDDVAVFNCIADAKKFVLPSSHTEYALLAQEDQYDVARLEICDGTITHIKVSFHNYDIEEGLKFCSEIVRKGYKCHINPINLQGYSDKQLLEIIDKVNEISPYAFTIVDTFGAMTEKDLNRIVSIVDNNLKGEINIGLHLHENLGLSFSLAQFFTKIKPVLRNISIDASLNGMGRIPGNLNVELIMDHMNRIYNKNYDLDPIFDAIDDYILPIKKIHSWGYSLPYALSAQYKLHRTYAEFLISKMKLKTRDIKAILSSIDPKEKIIYNKNYIESLYVNYLKNEINDVDAQQTLKKDLTGAKILLLAPGSSIITYQKEINDFINQNSPIIISTNFNSKQIGYNNEYIFFSNIKRFEQAEVDNEKIIITSNLYDQIDKADYVFNFGGLLNTKGAFVDNSLILLLNLLIKLKVNEVYLAGYDGFSESNNNYFIEQMIPSYEEMSSKYLENQVIKGILHNYVDKIKILSLTPSLYFDN